MPPKAKSSKKLSKHSSPESSWISKFCRGQDIPDDIKDVLAEHQITSKQVFPSITEQDLAAMGFLVGQKIVLRRVLSLLQQDGEGPPVDTANATLSASAKDLLPGFNLAEEISQLEAEFQVPQSTQENKASETATFATTSAASGSPSSATSGSKAALSSPASLSTNSSLEGKPLLPSDFVLSPDNKQLKPLQLSYSQFILANIKILESLFTKSPHEAADYLTYLKFLPIKGTRFQTKAILAFDQDYRATKAPDNFGWGNNLDSLSVHYFYAAVAQCPPRSESRRDSRGSGNDPGTLTQLVAQIHSRVATSTFVFTVPLLSITARDVRVPRTLRKAKNEPIL